MRTKTLKATIFVASAGAVLMPVAAHAANGNPSPSPQIVGGHPVTNPAVVQLEFSQGSGGGKSGCTGELIASQWVLTARHCTDGDSAMSVYFSNSTSDKGAPVEADRFLNSTSGDVGLVHLSKAAPIQQYVSLADSYSPKAGDTGQIQGYGLAANKQPTPSLYAASVKVLEASTDAFSGEAVHVQGGDGSSNHGDSGGPLLVGDKVVGVCSTGDSDDPGSNTQATSNYANLTKSRSWIRDNAGV